MKLHEINDIVPPKVLAFMVGKLFALYAKLLEEGGGRVVKIDVALEDPDLTVHFDIEGTKRPADNKAGLRKLCKELGLDYADFTVEKDFDAYDKYSCQIDLSLNKEVEIDEEAMEKGFRSVTLKTSYDMIEFM